MQNKITAMIGCQARANEQARTILTKQEVLWCRSTDEVLLWTAVLSWRLSFKVTSMVVSDWNTLQISLLVKPLSTFQHLPHLKIYHVLMVVGFYINTSIHTFYLVVFNAL